ncbi:MAG TPA: HAD-IB family phosphatase [Gemmatimonadaceae bacterium]|nr:HAD-IB family phosphatase [Gemmatimonadaceae bacterium]
MSGRSPAFATVVLDVDSTIAGVEGIDWLARRRGEDVAREIAGLTDDAMRGTIPLEEVYGRRLAAIRPRRDDVDALARAYIEAIAPGAVEALAELRRAGVHVVLVSSGLRPALLRLALELNVDPQDLHAVDIRFDALGTYIGFDEHSPLTTSHGKRDVIAALDVDRPLLMVGDGATDLAARDAVDRFAAYTGFARRAPVVQHADVVLDSFDQLVSLVLA